MFPALWLRESLKYRFKPVEFVESEKRGLARRSDYAAEEIQRGYWGGHSYGGEQRTDSRGNFWEQRVRHPLRSQRTEVSRCLGCRAEARVALGSRRSSLPYVHVLGAQHDTTNRETSAASFLASHAFYRILRPRTGEARCQTIRYSRYEPRLRSNSDQTHSELSRPHTVVFLYMRCTWFHLKFQISVSPRNHGQFF